MTPSRNISFLIYAACSLAVLAGLVWITLVAASLEAREHRTRADAALHNAIDVVMWRMDSVLNPFVAEQAGHRYFHYRAFYSAERAYTNMFEEILPDEVLIPSPLLAGPGEFVRLHFQVEPDGRVTSPQVPTGDLRDQAVAGGHATEEDLLSAEARLASLTALLGAGGRYKELASGANELLVAPPPPAQTAEVAGVQTRTAVSDEYQFRQQSAAMARESGKWAAAAPGGDSGLELSTNTAPSAAMPPAGEGAAESDTMLEAAKQAATAAAIAQARDSRPDAAPAAAPSGPAASPSGGVTERPLMPQWFTGSLEEGAQLFFVRVVQLADREIRQGIWLDWPVLHALLLSKTRDLLPTADLVPIYDRVWKEGHQPGRVLASVPALLVPGEPAFSPLPLFTPTRVALATTWLAVLLAIGAVGVVLRQSMDLAERRGQFVSAVTHELRTPMTTFCLYTQMLADGMVRDDGTRADYLGTLKNESQRLARIVENVLEFARLGRTTPSSRPGGRAAARRGQRPPDPSLAPCEARSLLDSLLPVLDRHAAQCGMTLDADTAAADSLRIVANPQTLERILLNLVDNSCKYAAESADKRVHLRAAAVRAGLEISVVDHGPGVPPAERGRIFAPFHRARRDSEGPSPGLGLGLALARGLARQLGGDLTLGPDAAGGGAHFVLRIPTA